MGSGVESGVEQEQQVTLFEETSTFLVVSIETLWEGDCWLGIWVHSCGAFLESSILNSQSGSLLSQCVGL